jgi:hypothetical protein
VELGLPPEGTIHQGKDSNGQEQAEGEVSLVLKVTAHFPKGDD